MGVKRLKKFDGTVLQSVGCHIPSEGGTIRSDIAAYHDSTDDASASLSRTAVPLPFTIMVPACLAMLKIV